MSFSFSLSKSELFKISNTHERTILHTLFVYHITTDSILAKNIVVQLTELDCTTGVGSLAHADYYIKIVELNVVKFYVSNSLSEIPTN